MFKALKQFCADFQEARRIRLEQDLYYYPEEADPWLLFKLIRRDLRGK